MFIKSIMIPKHACFVAQQDDTLDTVLEKLQEKDVDGLPILNGDEYAGIITRYGIYKSCFQSDLPKSEFMKQTKAADISTHQDQFLQGDEIFEKTLVDLKVFPIMAVVDEKKKFLGAVTRSDVVEQFTSAFGMHQPGVRIAFTSVETEGRIARLAEIAHQFHEHIISLVTFDETDKLVRRIVMKVEKKPNIEKFLSKLEASGFRVLNVSED
ncbi:hypothetical protein CVD28_18105 [Bacillus sp. M6-12]|uniref:CBS domain-containing protein n=1 Tax=Bacillus sp. M6-12 TaxID=2054166 RepID=UPI000C76FEBC|nr:CBS domain-containing protein [Bacillus sp. M6-12]PLS16379.1 hypothetical protein CVD28_18105 [Bacillus sp. M6-12]